MVSGISDDGKVHFIYIYEKEVYNSDKSKEPATILDVINNQGDACTFNGKDIRKKVLGSSFIDMAHIISRKYEVALDAAESNGKTIDERFNDWIESVMKSRGKEVPTYIDEYGREKKFDWSTYIENTVEDVTEDVIFKVKKGEFTMYYMRENGIPYDLFFNGDNVFDKFEITSGYNKDLVMSLEVPMDKVLDDVMDAIIEKSSSDADSDVSPIFTKKEAETVSELWKEGECFVDIMSKMYNPTEIIVKTPTLVSYDNEYFEKESRKIFKLPSIITLRYGKEGPKDINIVVPVSDKNTVMVCNGDLSISSTSLYEYFNEEDDFLYDCKSTDLQEHINVTSVQNALRLPKRGTTSRKGSLGGGVKVSDTSKHKDLRIAMREINDPEFSTQLGRFIGESNAVMKTDLLVEGEDLNAYIVKTIPKDEITLICLFFKYIV